MAAPRAAPGGCSCACPCASPTSDSCRGCWGGWRRSPGSSARAGPDPQRSPGRPYAAAVSIRRHADLVPEPPGPAAIARWVAALAARLGMRRHWRWWLIGTMLAVVVLAVVREPLGALLWPQTRAQALRA